MRRQRHAGVDVKPYYAVACAQLVAYAPAKLKVVDPRLDVSVQRYASGDEAAGSLAVFVTLLCRSLNWYVLGFASRRRELCTPSKKFGTPRVWVEQHFVKLMRDGASASQLLKCPLRTSRSLGARY